MSPAAVAAWCALCGARMPDPSLGQAALPFRLVIVALLLAQVVVSVGLAPDAGIVGVALMAPYLGYLRRALIPLAGYMGSDPITLLPLAAGAILFVRLIVRRAVDADTPIARWLLPLMAVMAIQVLNPKQGGIAVGLGGAVFFFAPMFWFFVGRDALKRHNLPNFLRAVQIGAVVSAAYGAYQMYAGFSEVERLWIDQSKYAQLVGGTYRVFSTFLSFGEYVGLVVLGSMISLSKVLERRYLHLPVFLFLTSMVALSSSRGAVLNMCFGAAVMWAISGRNQRAWIPRFAVAAILGFFAVVTGVQTANDLAESTPTKVSLEHQVEGLTNPLGERSTGRFHQNLVLIGLTAGFREPLGQGLGATTIAARKFSETETQSSEFDIGDMFIGSGLIGGTLYIVVVGLVVRSVLKAWQATRDPRYRTIAGMLATLFGAWMSGGYYSLSIIVWLLIGSLDRTVADLGRTPRGAVAPSETLPTATRGIQ